MKIAAIISAGLAATVALPAGAADCSGWALGIAGRAACVTFIAAKDGREWSAFVQPRDIERQAAARVAFSKGRAYCQDSFGLGADPTLRVTRGGWAAPNAMIYTGNCK
ncbi:MAG: hypothetical protein KDK02_14745 [Rhodobacteraceae bacterium]|nr:hypothetical protein [Paracoccaceae bacterium]